jgi:hypothetical protein
MIKLIRDTEECPKGYIRYKYDALRRCWFAGHWTYAFWLRLWTRLGDSVFRFLAGRTIREDLDAVRAELDEVHFTIRLKNAEIRSLQMELKAKDLELQLAQERMVRSVMVNPRAGKTRLSGEGG